MKHFTNQREHHACGAKSIVLLLAIGCCAGQTLVGDEQAAALVRNTFSSAFCFVDGRVLTSDINPSTKSACLWCIENGAELQRFDGHREVVRTVAVGPDRTQVLTGGGRVNDMGSESTDNSVRLWEIGTGREIRRLVGHTSFVHTVQFNRDGHRILTAGRDSTTRIWDTASGRQLFVLTGTHSFSPSASFDSAGQSVLALFGSGQRVIVWNAATGAERFRIEEPSDTLFTTAEFSPDDQLIVTASYDGTVRTWDAHTGAPAQVFSGHEAYVQRAAFSVDGDRIVSASHDGTVRLWEAKAAKEIKRFTNPGPVDDVLLNRSGTRILARWRLPTGVYDAPSASLWDAESGREMVRLIDNNLQRLVGFTPDGKRFISTKGAKPGVLWDAETGEIIRRYD